MYQAQLNKLAVKIKKILAQKLKDCNIYCLINDSQKLQVYVVSDSLKKISKRSEMLWNYLAKHLKDEEIFQISFIAGYTNAELKSTIFFEDVKYKKEKNKSIQNIDDDFPNIEGFINIYLIKHKELIDAKIFFSKNLNIDKLQTILKIIESKLVAARYKNKK